jgi:multidrug efflux pump subunit AcrA (membrane-fusion protein)
LLAGLGLTMLAASEAAGVELDCLIGPHVVVAVSSPVEGVVETIAVDRGDLVGKGHVLATLESSVERASVALAAARAGIK